MLPQLPDLHTPAAQLQYLAQSPDWTVRRAVAAHPNTPAAVLAVLGADFPAEVLANPALPLLRLAQPGLVAGWPTLTLERLAADSSAPEWLLRLAAAHPVIDVQLAAVTHPELSPAVLGLLATSAFWTIREYVARKPNLPPALTRQLAQDTDYGVRITVAGRADLPPDAAELLAQDSHPLVRSVVSLNREQG